MQTLPGFGPLIPAPLGYPAYPDIHKYPISDDTIWKVHGVRVLETSAVFSYNLPALGPLVPPYPENDMMREQYGWMYTHTVQFHFW